MSYVNKNCDVTTLAIQRGGTTRVICRCGRGDFKEREREMGERRRVICRVGSGDFSRERGERRCVICRGGGETLEERVEATRNM